MTRILISNLASPANPGDHAIFLGSLKLISEFVKEPCFTAATQAISLRKIYEDLGCRVVPCYPQVEGLQTDSLIEKILSVPRALSDPAPLRDAVKDSDMVFLAGGAYFYSHKRIMPGLLFRSHGTAARWAKKYGKPLILLPQSYGPFASRAARHLFNTVMDAADLVLYREEISGNWLKKEFPAGQKKIRFVPDLALYLEKKDLLDSEEIPCDAGVTIRAWNGAKNQETLSKISRALIRINRELGRNLRIIVQVQNAKYGEGDEPISLELKEMIEREVSPGALSIRSMRPYFDLKALCKIYSGCKYLIAGRLHSGLLSFVLGRPAAVLGYQHKAKGILNSLKLSDFYAGDFTNFNPEELYRVCSVFERQEEDVASKLETAMRKVRQEIASRFSDAAGPLL